MGEPGKSADVRPPFEDGVYAKWLSQVMDGLGIQKAAVAGNSMGGWLGLELTTHFPERVSALVLLAPAGLARVKRSFFIRLLPKVLEGKRGAQSLNHLLFGKAHIPDEAFGFAELLRQHYNPRPLKFLIFTGRCARSTEYARAVYRRRNRSAACTQKKAQRDCAGWFPRRMCAIASGLAHTHHRCRAGYQRVPRQDRDIGLTVRNSPFLP